MSNPASIAIDGPVASGKTVVGRLIAQRLGWRCLDTGTMYRALTWAAVARGMDLADEKSLEDLSNGVEIRLVANAAGDRLLLDCEDITEHLRRPDVERGVSLVARVSGVRSAMVRQQRSIAAQGPTVMVGRDIGTVVLKDAGLKVFLKASVNVRARRRLGELEERGRRPDYDQVVDDLVRRDKIDSERVDSPLRPAEQAFTINTDDLAIAEVVDKIMAALERVP